MELNNGDIFEDGALVVTLSSWDEFSQKVQSLTSKRGLVWRGQKKDEDNGWFLKSSFDRKVQSKDKHERTKKLEHHLFKFKELMNKSYPNVLPAEEDPIWALGQHYGLETPLLDWTLDPYIAAYFAFSEWNNPNDREDRYRYVYALDRALGRLLTKKKRAGEILDSERSVPFIDQLPLHSPRFVAQKGIFTKAIDGNDIWEHINTFSRKRPSALLIVKFKIPTKDREKCLTELHSKRIDHMNLLLDFHHVVGQCNLELCKKDSVVGRLMRYLTRFFNCTLR